MPWTPCCSEGDVPTFGAYARSLREFADPTGAEKAAFRRARKLFVADLQAGRPPRAGIRVRDMATESGVYELTWAPDGRATFEYGPPIHLGERHVIWRRIGGHGIFENP
jgi:hypothetical protein